MTTLKTAQKNLKHSIEIKHLPTTPLVKFAIDSPSPSMVPHNDHVYLLLKGWAYISGTRPATKIIIKNSFGEEEIPLEIDRPDVARVYPNAPDKCGYSKHIKPGQSIKIGIKNETTTVWFAEIIFSRIDALEGRDGYLFLDHDSNESTKQYTGDYQIDNHNISAWDLYFKKLSKEMTEKEINYTFFLAPSKEFVYPDHYPEHRLRPTPVDQFLTTFKDHQNILYPLKELIAQRNLSYPKTDTHWTDYGASTAAKAVLKKFHTEFKGEDLTYKIIKKSGDLGRKFQPPIFEDIPTIDFSFLNKNITFHNKINNRGEIRIFVNSEAPNHNTCVVFGDSFSVRLVNFLALSFRRIVHIFSGADIDYSILDHEKPKYVLIEITNRFIIKAPNTNYSLKSDLARKAINSSDSIINEIVEISRKNKLEKFYTQLTIEGLGRYIP